MPQHSFFGKLCHLHQGRLHFLFLKGPTSSAQNSHKKSVTALTGLSWCRKSAMPLPLPVSFNGNTILSDLHRYASKIDAASFCGLFHSVCVCVPARVYVRVSAPGGSLPIGLGPTDNSSQHSLCTQTSTPWQEINCHRGGNPLRRIFLGQSSSFRGLAWPGKVPELGLRAQMLLGSYLLRFLHEQLNCCNIGLGGL